MLDKIPEQFGGRPIHPVGEFYPSIFKSPSLFSSERENIDTTSSSGLYFEWQLVMQHFNDILFNNCNVCTMQMTKEI